MNKKLLVLFILSNCFCLFLGYQLGLVKMRPEIFTIETEKTFKDWQKAYNELLVEARYLDDGEENYYTRAALLYVNDDELPELLVRNGDHVKVYSYNYSFKVIKNIIDEYIECSIAFLPYHSMYSSADRGSFSCKEIDLDGKEIDSMSFPYCSTGGPNSPKQPADWYYEKYHVEKDFELVDGRADDHLSSEWFEEDEMVFYDLRIHDASNAILYLSENLEADIEN